jgi:hypothetical protein
MTAIEVVSDQIKYEAQVIEAPYVGVSLSTAQLYLTSNIGYQVFKNSFLTPNILSSIQVVAVLQNSFAVGMYMSGGGEFPVVMRDADASNLRFQLVDANYVPVKLMSPMFLIIKIDPTDNPAEDIKQFMDKLPIKVKPMFKAPYYESPKINLNEDDENFRVNRELRPTPETLQKIQAQQEAEAQAQAEAEAQAQALAQQQAQLQAQEEQAQRQQIEDVNQALDLAEKVF